MSPSGNLWLELWESSKPLPAIKQVPLFDDDLAVESILSAFECIHPCKLFEQLFISQVSSGFTIAEASLPPESNLSKLFNECKDYVVATCQNGISSDNFGDICKVYETMETIATHPREALTVMDRPEEPIPGESKSLFKKISLNFVGKDKQLFKRKTSKDEKNNSKDEKKHDEKQHLHVFSNPFDKKGSIFTRKNSKPNQVPSSEPDSLDGSDWTIV